MTYYKPSATASIAVANGRGTASNGDDDADNNAGDDEDNDDDDDDDDDDCMIVHDTTTSTTTAPPATTSTTATTTTASTSATAAALDILNHRRVCFACIVSTPSPTDDHVTVRIAATGHTDATVVTRVPIELICPPLTIDQVLQALQHLGKDEALVDITR